jgi:heme exporter protein D
MGGYGAFIWSAYGVAAVVMLGLLATSIHAARVNRRELAALEATGRTRRRPQSQAPRSQTPVSEETGDDAKAS